MSCYESQDVTGDAERVTETLEMLHVDDCGQIADMSEKSADCVRDGGEMSELEHDTREKLEADVRNVMSQWMFETGWTGNTAHGLHEHVVMRWLDRQASITEREFFETACQGCERLGGDGGPTLDELCDELRKYIVKTDRLGAALDDRDAQLADVRDALDAVWSERDQWRDAYRDSEQMRLELVKDLEHARRWSDRWRDLVHRYEGLCDGLLDERDRLRGEAS